MSLGRKTTIDIHFQVLEIVQLSTRVIYLFWGSISTSKIQRGTELESRKDWVTWLTHPPVVKPSERMTDSCQSLKKWYDPPPQTSVLIILILGEVFNLNSCPPLGFNQEDMNMSKAPSQPLGRPCGHRGEAEPLRDIRQMHNRKG